MNVYDLKNHFNVETFAEVASKMGKSKSTLTNWKQQGIPIEEQALIELGTNGKLKADRKQIRKLS